jgi:hypothetical protein
LDTGSRGRLGCHDESDKEFRKLAYQRTNLPAYPYNGTSGQRLTMVAVRLPSAATKCNAPDLTARASLPSEPAFLESGLASPHYSRLGGAAAPKLNLRRNLPSGAADHPASPHRRGDSGYCFTLDAATRPDRASAAQCCPAPASLTNCCWNADDKVELSLASRPADTAALRHGPPCGPAASCLAAATPRCLQSSSPKLPRHPPALLAGHRPRPPVGHWLPGPAGLPRRIQQGV